MKKIVSMICALLVLVCIGCGSAPAPEKRDSISRDEIKKRSDDATRELDSVVK